MWFISFVWHPFQSPQECFDLIQQSTHLLYRLQIKRMLRGFQELSLDKPYGFSKIRKTRNLSHDMNLFLKCWSFELFLLIHEKNWEFEWTVDWISWFEIFEMWHFRMNVWTNSIFWTPTLKWITCSWWRDPMTWHTFLRQLINWDL